MANVGMTSRGTMIVNGVEMNLPNGPIGVMRITGEGIWIDGVKQDPSTQSTSEDGKVTNLYFGSFEGCKIGRLEFKNCRVPDGVKFNNCEVKDVRTTMATVHVTGDIKGDVSTASGSVRCGGDLKGDAKTASGSISCEGTIKGGASSMSGSVRANKIRGSASSMSGAVNGKRVRGSRSANIVQHGAAGEHATYIKIGSDATSDDVQRAFQHRRTGGVAGTVTRPARNVVTHGVAEVSGTGTVFINGVPQRRSSTTRK